MNGKYLIDDFGTDDTIEFGSVNTSSELSVSFDIKGNILNLANREVLQAFQYSFKSDFDNDLSAIMISNYININHTTLISYPSECRRLLYIVALSGDCSNILDVIRFVEAQFRINVIKNDAMCAIDVNRAIYYVIYAKLVEFEHIETTLCASNGGSIVIRDHKRNPFYEACVCDTIVVVYSLISCNYDNTSKHYRLTIIPQYYKLNKTELIQEIEQPIRVRYIPTGEDGYILDKFTIYKYDKNVNIRTNLQRLNSSKGFQNYTPITALDSTAFWKYAYGVRFFEDDEDYITMVWLKLDSQALMSVPLRSVASSYHEVPRLKLGQNHASLMDPLLDAMRQIDIIENVVLYGFNNRTFNLRKASTLNRKANDETNEVTISFLSQTTRPHNAYEVGNEQSIRSVQECHNEFNKSTPIRHKRKASKIDESSLLLRPSKRKLSSGSSRTTYVSYTKHRPSHETKEADNTHFEEDEFNADFSFIALP